MFALAPAEQGRPTRKRVASRKASANQEQSHSSVISTTGTLKHDEFKGSPELHSKPDSKLDQAGICKSPKEQAHVTGGTEKDPCQKRDGVTDTGGHKFPGLLDHSEELQFCDDICGSETKS